jgi:hypothetical protein
LFYATRNADPQVIATDEALLAVGEKDVLFCSFLASNCSSAEILRKQEAPFYGPAAELSTYVPPESGHSIALHKNADEYREATRAWLRDRFGT